MISISVWKPRCERPMPRPLSGPASQPGQPPLRAGTNCDGADAAPALSRSTLATTPSRPSAPSAARRGPARRRARRRARARARARRRSSAADVGRCGLAWLPLLRLRRHASVQPRPLRLCAQAACPWRDWASRVRSAPRASDRGRARWTTTYATSQHANATRAGPRPAPAPRADPLRRRRRGACGGGTRAGASSSRPPSSPPR